MFYKKDKNLNESKLLLEDWKEDLFRWWYDRDGIYQSRAEALWLIWQMFYEHWNYLMQMKALCDATGNSGTTLSCEDVERLIRLAEKYRDTIPTCLDCPEWDEMFPDWVDPSTIEPEKDPPEDDDDKITPVAPVKPRPPFGKPTDPFSDTGLR